MTTQRLFFVMTRSLVMVAMAASFIGHSAVSAEAADETRVRFELTLNRTGGAMVKVVPPKAKIWRVTPDKPRAIYVTTINASEYDEVFWEIRFDDSKDGASIDYFGDVDIACGEVYPQGRIIEPSETPDAAGAEWPYTVTVYACAGETKAQVAGTASARIFWAD